MTVLGTRPEIIRLSRIIPLLDANSEHTLVHTGQNFDARLSDIFFKDLDVRLPDVQLDVRGRSFGEQIGQLLTKIEPVFERHRPERLLILGDTNSGLTAITARRLAIPVFHMEAGNRCFDFRVPEELNRRLIDHTSSILMPYTHRSRENLVREGIDTANIFVTGNPIKEVLDFYSDSIDASDVLERMGLEHRRFVLVTMHRAENVDVEARLKAVIDALKRIHSELGFPVICSLHPRTRSKAQAFNIELDAPGLRFVDPLGFFDFVKLERTAFCLVSDSGTVQEEACIFRTPNVTIRDVTERPETIECGSNVLTGCDPERILAAIRLVTSSPPSWHPPAEYLVPDVSARVGRIIVGAHPAVH